MAIQHHNHYDWPPANNDVMDDDSPGNLRFSSEESRRFFGCNKGKDSLLHETVAGIHLSRIGFSSDPGSGAPTQLLRGCFVDRSLRSHAPRNDVAS